MDPLAQKAKQIFMALVDDTPASEWESAADDACQGDERLRRRVRALLDAHAQPDSRLKDDAMCLPHTIELPMTIAEQPGTVIGRYKLLEKIGDPRNALKWLHKSADIFEDLQGDWESVVPMLTSVYWDIGAMHRSDDPQESVTWFQKALGLQRELCAKHPDVGAYKRRLVTFNYWLAMTYAMLEEYREAISYFDQVIASQPEHIDAIHQRAHVYWELEDYERTMADFELSLQLRPDWSESLNCYACLLATSVDQPFFDPARAVRLAQKSLDVDTETAIDSQAWDPKKAYRWNTLGIAQYRAGKFEQAIESLENCQRDAISPIAQIHNLLYLSMSYAKTGAPDAAQKCFDEAVTMICEDQPPDEDTEQLKTEALGVLEQGG